MLFNSYNGRYQAHRRVNYYSLLKRHSPREVIEILFALTATRGLGKGRKYSLNRYKHFQFNNFNSTRAVNQLNLKLCWEKTGIELNYMLIDKEYNITLARKTLKEFIIRYFNCHWPINEFQKKLFLTKFNEYLIEIKFPTNIYLVKEKRNYFHQIQSKEIDYILIVIKKKKRLLPPNSDERIHNLKTRSNKQTIVFRLPLHTRTNIIFRGQWRSLWRKYPRRIYNRWNAEWTWTW